MWLEDDMNAETRERVERIRKFIEHLPLHYGEYQQSALDQIDGILDASPEPARAEPVAWIHPDYLAEVERDGVSEGCQVSNAPESNVDVALYSAPPPPAMPPGWVAVPVEPTEEMVWAGKEAMRRSLAHLPAFSCYHAMLYAAPPHLAVSLPEGWPWDAETRNHLQSFLWHGYEHVLAEPDCEESVTQLARWLDQSPPTEDQT
jgi:hypothetical protein